MTVENNWAGNVTYTTSEVLRPRSVTELQELVATRPRVRALGTRHSFNDLADGPGALVSLEDMPAEITVTGQRVQVPAAVRYGVLARFLEDRGLALPNLASLPHISVAGATATGTHGSGDHNGCLSTSVAGLTLVTAAGAVRQVWRGDPEFAGSVVALGALGVVTGITLDVRPTFTVSQQVYVDVPWSPTTVDEILASGYSVSVFTNWTGPVQVWVKDTGDPVLPVEATPAGGPLHMLAGEAVTAVTEQGGVPGPWLDRLPHFRLGHKPSAGAELQTEYLLPRTALPEALTRLRRLAPAIAPLLQISEIRSVAADDLWLSGAYGRATAAIHFTWRLIPAGVAALLPEIEEQLLPLGARPHWGKLFATTELAALYPKWTDFAELRTHHDPHGKFGNNFLDRLFPPH